MDRSCLDDAALDDFVHARLEGERHVAAEAHLDRCPECTAVVSILVGGERPVQIAPLADLVAGGAVGRHVVRERLGAGAMGIVYLAHDPELDRRVALKVVRGGGAPEAQRRMLREAQAMAQVADPNVVAIYDVGRYADDSVYLAMEFVEGETLREWLRRERTPAEVLDVLLQAGRGLAAAHDAGLVHRDFKPDNVLVGRDGRVRVTDFGLARVHEAALPGDSGNDVSAAVRTQIGAIVGTPSYMAPELLVRGAEATAASDVFAFGVTLHEAACGVRPFVAPTIAELREKIRRGLPGAPARTLPARVKRVLGRALAVAPGDRYPSMRALLADLAPPKPKPRTWAWVVVGTVLSAAMILLATLRTVPRASDRCGAGTALADRALDAPRSARIRAAFLKTSLPFAPAAAGRVLDELAAYAGDWARAYRTTCEATEVRHEQSASMLDARMDCLQRHLVALDTMASTLESAGPDAVEHAAEAVAGLPRIDACADRTSLQAVEPRPAGDARARLDRLETELARTDAAMATGVGAVQLLPVTRAMVATADAIGYRPAAAEAHLLLATLSRRSGSFTDAVRETNAALLAAEASHDDRTAALAWLELLATRGEEGDTAAVIDDGGPALAAIARLGTPADLEGSAWFALGVARTARGDLEGARHDLEGSLERRTRALGEKHLDVARTLGALGNVARARGDLDRALTLHQRALAIDTDLLGPAHPALARHDHNIAGVLRLQGKLDEALASYVRALALEQEGLGPRHPAVGRTENSIGLVWLERGEPRAARLHFDVARDILAGHPEVGLVLHNLGLTDAAEGNHRAAIQRYDEALLVDRAALTPDNPELAAVLASRDASARALRRPPRPASPVPPPPGFAGSYAPAQSWDTAHR